MIPVIFYKGIQYYILNMGYIKSLDEDQEGLESVMQIQRVEMAHGAGKEKTETVREQDTNIYYPISGLDCESTEWTLGVLQYYLNRNNPNE